MNQNIYINEIPSAELTIYDNGTPVTVVIANGAVSQNKVPYTGATQNVNLGEYGISAGFVQLDTTPTTYTPAVGNMGWNDSEGTIDLLLKGGVVSLPLGQKQVARVVNGTGGNVLKSNYQVVKVTGAQGQRLQVNLAQANNDANSADTLGLIAENINNNNSGFIITSGLVENINTTGGLQSETWTDGNILYLSPTTPGAITNVKPQAPNHTVIVGFVVYAHANNGKIFVKVDNGYELDELHNVLINTGTLANGQVLKYNSSLQVWENNTDAAGTGTVTQVNALTLGTTGTDLSSSVANSTTTPTITLNVPTASATNRGVLSSTDWTTFNNKQNALTNPVTGTGTSGQVAYWNGTTTQTGSNNLFWDNANGRLGIGTTSPQQPIHITGTGSSSAGRTWLRIENTQTSSGSGVQLYNGNSRFAAVQYTGSTYPTGEALSFFTEGDYPVSFVTNGASPSGGTSYIAFSPGGYSSELARFTGNGRVLIGSTTDSGQRLQVTGDTLLKGSGNTSGTTALTVQNSDSSNSFRVLNNGQIRLGNTSNGFIFYPSTTSYTVDLAGTNVAFYNYTTSQAATSGRYLFGGNTGTQTSGTQRFFFLDDIFAPTSGTATNETLRVVSTINQTGGANGITRGLYVNPTLTAAADWRSIEWSNNSGWGLYGAGTANNYLAGSLNIGGTSLTGYNLRLQKSISGAANSFAISQSGLVASTVSSAYGYYNISNTQAASFTLTSYDHFRSDQGTIGLGSSITNQTGFRADSTLTGATNNYGFYGDIASGTGRWNLYMNGTALNYLNGSLLVGTTTDAGFKLDVNGTARVQGTLVGTGIISAATEYRLNQASYSRCAIVGSGGSIAGGYNFKLTGDVPQHDSNGAISGYFQKSDGNYDFFTGTSQAAGTNATIRARIASSGNFLIGTSTDSTFKLDVNGTFRVTGASQFEGDVTITDADNLVFGTTTGTKIGSATSQKLGFWNATPIVQPTTGVAGATRVGGGGTTLTDTDTFDGYTLAQIVKALRNTGILA